MGNNINNKTKRDSIRKIKVIFPTPNVRNKDQFIRSVERRVKKELKQCLGDYTKNNKKVCVLLIGPKDYKKNVIEHIIKKSLYFIEILNNSNKKNRDCIKCLTQTCEQVIIDFLEHIINNNLMTFINKINGQCYPLMSIKEEECYLYYLTEIKGISLSKAISMVKRDPKIKNIYNSKYEELKNLETIVPNLRYNIVAFIKNLIRHC